MSERTLKQLVGALTVVGGIWLVTVLLPGGGGGIDASGGIVSLFEGIDPDEVQGATLSGPDTRTTLVRTEEGWRADGWEADATPIAQFLNELRGLQIGDLTATNPANHERMGVDDAGAYRMELDVAGQARTLLVGSQGSRFATAYARLPDEDAVYLLEGDLRIHLSRTLEQWRDKQMISVDTTALQRVEVEREGESYTVVRGDSVWTFEDGSAVDETELRGMMAELFSVLASGFLAEGDSVLTLPQGGSSRAFDATGAVLSDLTVGSGSGERWARVEGDSIVYRLSTFRVGRLLPALEDMRAEGN